MGPGECELLARPTQCSLSLSQRGTEEKSAEKTITIKCQRLTADKMYEEVEIEVPGPVYKNLQGAEGERKDVWTRIKGLFTRAA